MDESDAIVTVDVGGQIFKTFKSTLCKCGYFKVLFSRRWRPCDVPFVDRDPKIFRKILRHLRDPQYSVSKKYQPDMDFFQMTEPHKTIFYPFECNKACDRLATVPLQEGEEYPFDANISIAIKVLRPLDQHLEFWLGVLPVQGDLFLYSPVGQRTCRQKFAAIFGTWTPETLSTDTIIPNVKGCICDLKANLEEEMDFDLTYHNDFTYKIVITVCGGILREDDLEIHVNYLNQI